MAKKTNKQDLPPKVKAVSGDNVKDDKKKKKKKKGCGCLTVLITFVVIITITLTAGYFVGDYFVKEYLGVSLGDIFSTANGLLSSNEKKLVKNKYSQSDLTELEGALRDRLLLIDEYAIPYDQISSASSMDTTALSLLIKEQDIDTAKLKNFVYRGPDATDVSLNLTDKSLAALLDMVVLELPMIDEALEGAGLPKGALELSIPQIYFITENNPNYNAASAVSTFSTEAENDENNDGENETATPEPEFIYSLKLTLKVNARLLGEAFLNQSNPSLTKWVSWLIPKNFFITIEQPINYKRAPKLYINNMNDKKMAKAYKVFDAVMALAGDNTHAEDLLAKVSDAIYPTLSELNSQGLFNFKKTADNKTVLNLDFIKTVLQMAGIEGVESRDIYFVLKTLMLDAGIEIDEEAIERARTDLDKEFEEKYLLKEDTSVTKLINGLMGTSDSGSEENNEPENEEPTEKLSRLSAATFEETSGTGESSGGSTDELLKYVDTAKMKDLYEKDIGQLDVVLYEEGLTALMQDVLASGSFDISGMTFDVAQVTLSKNAAGNTILSLLIALSPRSMLGDSADGTLGFLLNLLPKAMYIEAHVNLYDVLPATDDESSGSDIEINNAGIDDTETILNILSKFMGDSLDIKTLTDDAATSVRSLIDEIKKIIGIEFLTETVEGGEPGEIRVYAKLDNIFKLMCNQLNLTKSDENAPGEKVALEDHELKRLLSQMQVKEADEEDNKNNVLDALVERDAGETVDEYENGIKNKADQFMERLNYNYYIAEEHEIGSDAFISGEVGSTISANKINGIRMRNDERPLGDLGVLLDDRALTHIIKSKLEGEDGTSLGAGVRLVQTSTDVETNNVKIKLVVEIDLSVYENAKQAYESIPGLIPKYMYILSVTSFDTSANNIVVKTESSDPDAVDSTQLTLNIMGQKDTDLLLDIMAQFGGNAIDLDSMKSTISKSLKDSLTTLEESLTDDGKLLMEYKKDGIQLPPIYDMMRKYVLTKGNPADRLSAQDLMTVVRDLEYKDDSLDFPTLGNYYNEAANGYVGDEIDDETGELIKFEKVRENYDKSLTAATEAFEAKIAEKYFLTAEIDTNELFDTKSGVYSLDSTNDKSILNKFDGAAMRSNTATLEGLKFTMNEKTMIGIINSQIAGKITDKTSVTGASIEAFNLGEDDADDSSGDNDGDDNNGGNTGTAGNAYNVISIDVKNAGGNLTFVIVVEAELKGDDLADAGNVLPERIYVTTIVEFKADTAAEALQNKSDGNEDNDPANKVILNGMSEDTDKIRFNSLLSQLGVSFDFNEVGNTLQNNLIETLANLESIIDIKYDGNDDDKVNNGNENPDKEDGIVMPTVYGQLNKMMSKNNEEYETTKLSEEALKQLFENMDASSNLYINNGLTVSEEYKLEYPVKKDYADVADYNIAAANHEYLLLSEEGKYLQNLAAGFATQYAFAKTIPVSSITSSNIDNALGGFEAPDIIMSRIYIDNGNPHIEFTIKLNVANATMANLLTGEIYVTATIYYNGTDWVDKDGYDFNNLSFKNHYDGIGVTGNNMQESFEVLITKGFNNSGGFGSIISAVTGAMKTAVRGLETIYKISYRIDDCTVTGYPWIYDNGVGNIFQGEVYANVGNMLLTPKIGI